MGLFRNKCIMFCCNQSLFFNLVNLKCNSALLSSLCLFSGVCTLYFVSVTGFIFSVASDARFPLEMNIIKLKRSLLSRYKFYILCLYLVVVPDGLVPFSCWDSRGRVAGVCWVATVFPLVVAKCLEEDTQRSGSSRFCSGLGLLALAQGRRLFASFLYIH